MSLYDGVADCSCSDQITKTPRALNCLDTLTGQGFESVVGALFEAVCRFNALAGFADRSTYKWQRIFK
jgi:hypothetical protein